MKELRGSWDHIMAVLVTEYMIKSLPISHLQDEGSSMEGMDDPFEKPGTHFQIPEQPVGNWSAPTPSVIVQGSWE